MKVIIDRFEGEDAIVELPDKRMANLPRVLVPEAVEGDVIRIEIDEEETHARAGRIGALMDELWA